MKHGNGNCVKRCVLSRAEFNRTGERFLGVLFFIMQFLEMAFSLK